MVPVPLQLVSPFETDGLSPTAGVFDLPFAEDGEDDMDMFLNLEEAEEPQHSSDSSKEHCLEEDEERSSSFIYL